MLPMGRETESKACRSLEQHSTMPGSQSSTWWGRHLTCKQGGWNQKGWGSVLELRGPTASLRIPGLSGNLRADLGNTSDCPLVWLRTVARLEIEVLAVQVGATHMLREP